MYRILIVEDSKLIIRDLKRILNSAEYPSDIFEAYNGKDALEMIDSIKPDIIFSDIKMQIMNGLEFIQKAKVQNPNLKCVIISGYSDFEFTHEALRLQVDDYIVKPVDDQQLINVYIRLVEELEVKRTQKEEALIANTIQSFPGTMPAFLPSKIIMTLIMVGFNQEYSSQISRKAIAENLSELSDSRSYWIVSSRAGNEKIIIYNLNYYSLDDVKNLNDGLLSRLMKEFMRINIISSNIIDSETDLSNQYEILHYQLKRSILFDLNGVYAVAEPTSFHHKYILQKEQVSSFQKKICQLLNAKHKEDYDTVIHSEIQRWKDEKITIALLRKYIVVILDELFVLACGIELPADDPTTMADRMLNSMSSFALLEKQLYEYSNNVWEAQNDKVIVSADLIKSIEAFMKAHLYDNISLQEISEFLDLSASYICRIFKIYYNDTPISFYNQLKIQEAKRIIEEYQEMKIKDVSDMLGFNDQYYFSKVFKQQYGMSPSVFRSQLTEFPE